MLLLKLLCLILPLIIFCFIMKIAPPPLHPLWPGLGGGGGVRTLVVSTMSQVPNSTISQQVVSDNLVAT